MRAGLWKRILALTMAAVLLATDAAPVHATGQEAKTAEEVNTQEDASDFGEKSDQELSEEDSSKQDESQSDQGSLTEESEDSQEASEESQDSSEANTESLSSEPSDEIPQDTVTGGDTGALEEEPAIRTFEQLVNGVKVTLCAPEDAFEEGTVLSATEVEPAEVVIQKAEENVQEIVQRYRAFDINLVKDGEFVQPLNNRSVTVSFEGDMLLPAEEETVAVYHADDEDEITDMNAEVITNEETGTEEVTLSTTHFSTYVIVITAASQTKSITYRHFLGQYQTGTSAAGQAEQIYAPMTQQMEGRELTISELPIQDEANYTLTAVVVKEEGKQPVLYSNDVNSDTIVALSPMTTEVTIEFYYDEVKQLYRNSTTFFDYDVKGTVSSTEEVFEEYEVWWGRKIESCTFGGKTYTDLEFRSMQRMGRLQYVFGTEKWSWNGWTKEWETAFSVKNGDILKNVKYTVNSKTYEIAEMKFVVENGKTILRSTASTVSTSTEYKEKNAGINQYYTKQYEDAYLAMGQTGGQHDYRLMMPVGNGKNIDNANVNLTGNYKQNGMNDASYAIVPGIIVGLSGTGYETVETGTNAYGKKIYEPGYFSGTPLNGKTIYDNRFELQFVQEGNTYTLWNILDTQTNTTTEALKSGYDQISYKTYNKDTLKEENVNWQFFPLNNVESRETNTGSDNCFYGMRYDFTFELGDYIGSMEYTFCGDDDLWVFLDGKPILDLGGQHSSYPLGYAAGSHHGFVTYEAGVDPDFVVDLWQYLGVDTSQEEWYLNDPAYLALDKEEEHQITILYMERGAYDSTCFMQFVIPNVTSKEPVVTETPKTSLELLKRISGTRTPISNVEFTLYADAACTEVLQTRDTDNSGKVKFSGLKKGTYYLKETGYDAQVYEALTTVWRVEVTGDETLTAVLFDEAGAAMTEREEQAYVIYNTLIPRMDVEFVKTDRFDNTVTLAGAVFVLYENDKEGSRLAEVTTAADGKVVFEGLTRGTYYMEEITAPEGYRLPEQGWTFTVVSSGSGLVCTVTDGPENLYTQSFLYNEKNIVVTVTKKWEDGRGGSIEAGADTVIAELWRSHEDECRVIGKHAQKVAEVTLNESNKWTVDVSTDAGGNLLEEYGGADNQKWSYYIKELDTPGYTAEYEEPEVTQTEDGINIELVMTNIPDNGALVITKTVDKVNLIHGKAAFVFKIEGPEDMVLYRTITFDEETQTQTSKSLRIANLPVGDYTVTELSALRYKLDEAASDQGVVKQVSAVAEPEFQFKNTKDYDNYYSHTDVCVNKVTFTKDENGNITGSNISQLIMSESDETN